MTYNIATNTFKSLLITLVLLSSQIFAQEESYEPSQFCCDESVDCGCKCPQRFWGGAEYLYWKIKNSPEPVPFLATAPVIKNHHAVLGKPDSSVILGGKDIRNHWRSGGRFKIGAWFDNECRYGAEANYFFLPDESKHQKRSANGLAGSPFWSVHFLILEPVKKVHHLLMYPEGLVGRRN